MEITSIFDSDVKVPEGRARACVSVCVYVYVCVYLCVCGVCVMLKAGSGGWSSKHMEGLICVPVNPVFDLSIMVV